MDKSKRVARIRRLKREIAALQKLQEKGFWRAIGMWLVLWAAFAAAAFLLFDYSSLMSTAPWAKVAVALLSGIACTCLLKEARVTFIVVVFGLFSIAFEILVSLLCGEWIGGMGPSEIGDASSYSNESRNRRRIARALAKREYQLKKLESERNDQYPRFHTSRP